MSKWTIRCAVESDWSVYSTLDKHITRETFEQKLATGSYIYVAEENGVIIGVLRWGLFWDCIPFCNMLVVASERQYKGIGTALMLYWESLMHGYDTVMTSTQADETSQHFYRKLGYSDIGGFRNEDGSFELLMQKSLNDHEDV